MFCMIYSLSTMSLGPGRSSPNIEVMGLISPNIPANKPHNLPAPRGSHLHEMFFSQELLGLRMKPIGLKPTPDAQVPLDYARWCDADPPENLKVWHGFREVGAVLGVDFEELSGLVEVGLCFYWKCHPINMARVIWQEEEVQQKVIVTYCNQLPKLV